jgi:hypothetical protein
MACDAMVTDRAAHATSIDAPFLRGVVFETAKKSGLNNFPFSKILAIRTPIPLVIATGYEMFATSHGELRNQPVLRPHDRSVPLN